MVRAIAVLKGDSKVRLLSSVSLPALPSPPAGRETASLAHTLQPQVSGQVVFEQADENSPVTVSGKIEGNDANAQRGFHVQ